MSKPMQIPTMKVYVDGVETERDIVSYGDSPLCAPVPKLYRGEEVAYFSDRVCITVPEFPQQTPATPRQELHESALAFLRQTKAFLGPHHPLVADLSHWICRLLGQ